MLRSIVAGPEHEYTQCFTLKVTLYPMCIQSHRHIDTVVLEVQFRHFLTIRVDINPSLCGQHWPQGRCSSQSEGVAETNLLIHWNQRPCKSFHTRRCSFTQSHHLLTVLHLFLYSLCLGFLEQWSSNLVHLSLGTGKCFPPTWSKHVVHLLQILHSRDHIAEQNRPEQWTIISTHKYNGKSHLVKATGKYSLFLLP